MTKETLTRISTYSMKLQAYPNKEQKVKIDRILHGLHVAYNITFHEVFQKNPAVCTEEKDGACWPDYGKMASASWRAHLIEVNPIVAEVPAASLQTNNGIFHSDAQRAWKMGMFNRPISQEMRREFKFYSKNKPRLSYCIQTECKNIIVSEGNSKVAWIKLPKLGKPVKVRGFNQKLRFGENGQLSFAEAVCKGVVSNSLTVRVSKDLCDNYFVVITFTDGKKHNLPLFLKSHSREETSSVGIDVGIKDLATTSNGEKIANPKYKKDKIQLLSRLSRQLTRRWGPLNPSFRDYRKDIWDQNSEFEESTPTLPSKRYQKIKLKKALIERKVARKRNSYYHQQTANIVKHADMVAVETLRVKNMMRNHKLAFALSDAALSDFLQMLKYKSERVNVPLLTIGMFEPSSQMCHVCNYINADVKNLSVRSWTCPSCLTVHDRDINAAKNILSIALAKGGAEDIELPSDETKEKKKKSRRTRREVISEDQPEIIVKYCRSLSKLHDPRYIIINSKTNTILDDAQGAGYRSMNNARRCFIAKKKWSEIKPESRLA